VAKNEETNVEQSRSIDPGYQMEHLEWLEDNPEVGDVNLQGGSREMSSM
jgi:hypothetical protein